MRSVIVVAVADVLAFVIVAATHPGAEMAETFVAFSLVCGAVMCAWQAANRGDQEGELIGTAHALSVSEATTRLRESQQAEIARFGQRALAGEPPEHLMGDVVASISRALGRRLVAVLAAHR